MVELAEHPFIQSVPENDFHVCILTFYSCMYFYFVFNYLYNFNSFVDNYGTEKAGNGY